MSEWKTYKLGELVTFQRGHDLPRIEMENGIYPVAGSNSIIGYHDKFTTKGPGITIGRSGNIGNPQLYMSNFWAHNTVLYVKEFKKVDPVFFYYLLKTLDFTQLNSGSAVPSLNRNFIHPFKVRIPEDLPTQTAIAEILSSLDDKIELNNKINAELETLAQTLFKHWFVDFEFPDDNGNPYKSSGGEMEDSELGEIPKGWEVKKMSDLIEVTDGTHDSPKQSDNGHFLVTSKHLKDSYIDFNSAYKISNKDFIEINKRSKVDMYDILITMIGTVGNLYFVGREADFAIKNIGLFKSSKNTKFSYFLFEYLKSNGISEYYKARLTGSTQQYLTLKVLRETPVLVNERIAELFIENTSELRNYIIGNSIENQSLINLRDTLLPKLISGEIELT